jgi:biopolymer transport protein ExbD
MLKTRQHGPGDGADSAVVETFPILVVVNQNGFVVVEGRQDHKVVPLNGTGLDFTGLTHELETVKRAHPDSTDVQVAPEDDVAFETMVKTMDAILTAGVPDVSLTDASAGVTAI